MSEIADELRKWVERENARNDEIRERRQRAVDEARGERERQAPSTPKEPSR